MKKILIGFIFLMPNLVLAQKVSDLVNSRIVKDQNTISEDTAYIARRQNIIKQEQDDIANRQAEIINAQADMDSYNAKLPSVQNLDSQLNAVDVNAIGP